MKVLKKKRVVTDLEELNSVFFYACAILVTSLTLWIQKRVGFGERVCVKVQKCNAGVQGYS